MKAILITVVATLAILLLALFTPSATALDGSTQLRLLFDAAIIRMQLDGTLASFISENNITGYVYVVECSPIVDFYPFIPLENLAYRTKNIVSGVRALRIATVENEDISVNTSTNPPTGYYVDLMTAIADRIGSFYNTTISLQWFVGSSSPEVFQMLLNNTADTTTPNFSQGAFYLTARRKLAFQHSCNVFGFENTIATLVNSSYTTIDEVTSSSGLTGCTNGAGSLAVAEGTVSAVTWTNTADCFDALINGTYTFGFGFTSDDSPLFASFSAESVDITSNFFRLRGDISKYLDVTQG